MASIPVLLPSPDVRDRLADRGLGTAVRCYQCATCSGVCELAPSEAPFPRQQMLWAQWGMVDRLAADPAVWLCHQCNDCTVRCPRDAQPGDVLQALRSVIIERLSFPRAFGRLVAGARASWPILLGVPIAFWIVLLGVTGHLAIPAGLEAGWGYDALVPHAFIYGVFFPVAAWTLIAMWVGGRRHWKLMGAHTPREGSFLADLVPSVGEIAIHSRFSSCDTAAPRRLGHLLLLWGFVGAAITSALLIVAMYVQGLHMPLELTHPYKILGNLSAALLVAGGAILVGNRIGDPKVAGRSHAFDIFFLGVVVLVIVTGLVVEGARLADAPAVALWTYIVHLGSVMCLFLTFPYSKFAHMVYRTLAMVHQRMVERASAQ